MERQNELKRNKKKRQIKKKTEETKKIIVLKIWPNLEKDKKTRKIRNFGTLYEERQLKD